MKWKFSTPSVLRGLHHISGFVLRKAGYRFEIRRSGELKMGLWRKSLAPRSSGTREVRRFVLLPGWGDTPISWLNVLVLLRPVLRKKYDEIVLVDFPGFQGFLQNEKCFESMDLLLESSFDVLDSLKPHTVFGHSLGGWIAAAYAGRCGKKERPLTPSPGYCGPETVILANPSGAFGSEEQKHEWKARFDRAREEGFHSFREHLFAHEPFWFRWIVPEFVRFLKREDVTQFMLSFREEHRVEHLLESIQAQVWVLWGEKDSLVPSAWAKTWLECLRNSTLVRGVMIRGAGHSPHIEKPLATAGVIAQALLGKEPHRFGQIFWRLIPHYSNEIR
jgi:pimeloyl-ACP methyl ester carboxylesterase